MAKALMVTSSFLPGRGGIESYLGELCTLAAPHLAVLAPAQRDGKPLPTNLGYPTMALPATPFPSRRVCSAIERAAAEVGTRRIIFGTPWPLGLLGPRLAARGYTYAVIVHGSELLAPAAVPILRARIVRAMRGAQLLLPVSDFTSKRLQHLVGASGPPVERLRARVDLDRFSPAADATRARANLGLEKDHRLVLCFGRLVPRKGADRLIEALPEIASAHPAVTLVIAGTGPQEKKLRRLAANQANRIAFVGRVPEEQAPGLYAAADVFVLPVADRWFGLDTEGLGVVLLEAAACGAPCVTGESGGTSEAVLHGRTGFVIDARKRTHLVEAIVRLLGDPQLATDMGAAGRRHVEGNFSSNTPPKALLKWLG